MQALAAKISAYDAEAVIMHAPVIRMHLVAHEIGKEGQWLALPGRDGDITAAPTSFDHAVHPV